MYLNIRCILTLILFSTVLCKKHYLIETVDHDNHNTSADVDASLIYISSFDTKSVEACCNEEHLLRCSEVTVDPTLLFSGKDINILGSDLVSVEIIK